MILLTKSFLRFPRPPTVSASGGSSGFPSGSWIPRDVRKSPNAVETGLSVHVEPVIRGDIERANASPSLRRTLLQIFVKHLFPTPPRAGWRCPLSHRRDQVGRRRTGRGDRRLALGLLHRSLSCNRRTSLAEREIALNRSRWLCRGQSDTNSIELFLPRSSRGLSTFLIAAITAF